MLIIRVATVFKLKKQFCLILSSVALAFAIPATAWEAPKIKPKENFLGYCAYGAEEWYREYLNVLNGGNNDRDWPAVYTSQILTKTKNGGFQIKNRYESVEAVLVRAGTKPRALTILALEQFMESARLKSQDSDNDSLSKIQSQILLSKAIDNLKLAAEQNFFRAKEYLFFWEFLGITEKLPIEESLKKLRALATEGSTFALNLYVQHRRSREWSFYLEALESRNKLGNYNPMGYIKCGQELHSEGPRLLSDIEGRGGPWKWGGDNDERVWWDPFGSSFRVKMSEQGQQYYMDATCIHLLDLINGNKLSATTIGLMNNCFYSDSVEYKALLESVMNSGDPVVLAELADFYLTDEDPSNDSKAEKLLLMNRDKQPIWARNSLLAAYSTVLPNPEKCLGIKHELQPFYRRIREISPDLPLNNQPGFSGTRYDNKGYGEKMRGHVRFHGGNACYDNFVEVNGEQYQLEYTSYMGVILHVYFDLDKPREFLNLKGRGYPSTDGFNAKYSLLDQSIVVTSSVYIGEESDRR